MTVTVRIAPSPTGNLHIGTARTALFNWLFARRNGGRFILRVEDTDVERSTRSYESNIIEGLKWLGLDWDNEQIFRQSERLPIYRKQLERLMMDGTAFWCHHTVTELEDEKNRQMECKEAVRHVCEHKGTPKAREKGLIIRLATDTDSDRPIAFDDIIRGSIETAEKFIGDLSLAKDLDTPLYNLAVVADDVDMAITHVIRGEDHISNTPKQLLIYRALGATPPRFAHLPLILGPDRSKLSKRHGATSLTEYQADYLPDALVNFMGTLGYTYDREMLTRDEMAAQFDLANVHKSGAVFDVKKLNWFNAQYVRRLTPRQFKTLIGRPDLPDAAVPLMTERLEKLSDIAQSSYFWELPEYDADLLRWKDSTREDTLRALQMAAALVPLTQDGLDRLTHEHFGGQKGSVYWPVRVALAGQRNSAGPLDVATVIGPGQTAARLAVAIKKLTA